MRKMRAKLQNNTLPAAIKFSFHCKILFGFKNGRGGTMNQEQHIKPLKTILKLMIKKE